MPPSASRPSLSAQVDVLVEFNAIFSDFRNLFVFSSALILKITDLGLQYGMVVGAN